MASSLKMWKVNLIELQEEEREVLLSIYEGDEQFKEISSTTYQYKYGEENDPKSFLVEIIWTENYPNEKPKINMDTFYNKHLVAEVKEKIMNAILEEAEQFVGAAMTYSIFEFVKEKEKELIEDQPEVAINTDIDACDSKLQDLGLESKKAPKKEILTKAQKRRQWDKVDSKGEKPRGWNWVDLVKHLSQTGSKASPEPEIPSKSSTS